jgi:hypothetical protein
MTPLELLSLLYQWASQQALSLLAAAVLIPLTGVALARILRGKTTGGAGEQIANGLTLSAVAVFLIALLTGFIAHWAFNASLWQANLLLLLAPLTYLVLSFVGVHWVFPLNRLASVRTLKDIGMFLAACLLVIWLLGKFRGWGIIFLGGTLQVVLIGLGLYWLLRRLWKQVRGQ